MPVGSLGEAILGWRHSVHLFTQLEHSRLDVGTYEAMHRAVAIILIVASALAIAAMGALRYATVHSASRLRKAQKLLEKDIESHLPPGSELTSVEEFLNQRSMHHTDLEHMDGAMAIHNGSEDILEASSADTDTGIYPLGSCSFLIIFRFDKNGTLQGYSDKPSCKAIF